MYEYKFIAIMFLSLFTLLSCTENKIRKHSNDYDDLRFAYTNNNETKANYFPYKIGDSVIYVGQTHYKKMPNNFDTFYNDTINIYKFYENIITYRVKEIRYKWLTPLPGQTLNDIMISAIRDSFHLNSNNRYEYIVEEKNFSRGIKMVFRNDDSLYFQDYENDKNDKINEVHTFRGKKLGK